MSRRLAREIAFKTLFQYDIGKNEVEPTISQLIEENGLEGAGVEFSRQLVLGTLKNLDAIDQALAGYLQKWELGRLAAVDRNVLRLAAFEILYREDIPAAVTINEALELSKAFHSEEAAKFLNGVLDKLARHQEGKEVE
ncbi:transcription antitermination factor NusB [Dethiobacter alkaliphilus]|uniref:transcription antitermination factor NusB n=1 Tax=Dethiobacter alkaliphilus TaxID=427926 RepID=UPI002226A44E|nr:transcription antitermination factor NusB [Dethiobacter alkaliphilus]MCW3490270.1 transcription antitermination factor NusB [Dethiobacter alkaliphilus]